MMFISTFIVLIITAVSMLKKASESIVEPKNANFKKLQTQYLIVYYIVTFADWLQGAYVYQVYSDYGYTEYDIAILYIVGFLSSSICGNFVGHLADLYGRKPMNASYGIIYSLCCLTKLSSNFYILFVGRIFGGIATSILLTTFEAWYINEHTNNYNLPIDWLNLTFSKASFYTGFLAIIAGVISQISADVLKLGPASPFLIAVPFLLTSTLIIITSWSETPRPNASSNIEIISPLKLIFSEKPKLILVGLIQSLFEATMYTFIFSWTPIIGSLKPPLGLVFSIFMVSYMIGSKLYALMISNHFQAENILTCISLLSFLSLSLVTLLLYIMKRRLEIGILDSTTETLLTQICFYCFVVYEFCVGIYVPAIGYIKGKIVPEEYRASVTNWFRVPMNIFTCFTLMVNHFYVKELQSPSNLNIFKQFTCIHLLCSIFLTINLLLTLIYTHKNTILREVNQNQVTNKLSINSVEFVTKKQFHIDKTTPVNSK